MRKSLKKTLITASSLILLSGCELLNPTKPKLLLTTNPTKSDMDFDQIQTKPVNTTVAKPKNEFFTNNENPINETKSANTNTPKRRGEFNLNFEEADLSEVSKVILGDILAKNYVINPKLAGKVTLQTAHPLSKEELLPTFESILQMNNASLIKDGDIFRIEPSNEALYNSAITTGRMGNAGYQTRVIPVKNVAVQNIVEIIKPLVHEKTVLSVDGLRNILIASGSSDEMARVLDIVKTFDIDILRGRSFALFPLAHVDPETLIKELDEVFYKKSSKEKDDNEFFRFISIERLNAILAITHQSRYLQDIEQWISRLDRANASAGGGVNVYKVQHADAVELAETLNDIFGNGSSKRGEKSKLSPTKKSGEVTNKSSTDKNKTTSNNSLTQRKTSGTNQIGDAKVSNVGDVRIIADETNNSLIIVATAQEYEIIRPIITQLDVMPLQVLVDATIVEVTLTGNLKYGIQWYFNHGIDGHSNIANSGGLDRVTQTSLSSIAASVATSGFGYSFLSKSGDISAVLNSQADNNKVNVISSPSLMVLNNQEASMQVGKEISLTTGQLGSLNNANTTGNTNNVFSQQQQRKTGVKLKIKPRVNSNGLVTMEIEQSVEDPGEIPANGGNPPILTREITSSVAVQSGETIVLGGLIKDNNTDSSAGVPFLHEIPVLGTLFGSTTKNQDKTELVVLITPRVVKSRQDAGQITNEFKRKLSGIYEEPQNN